MTAPFKAEKTGSYTCGQCMQVFHIGPGRNPTTRVYKCDDCGRSYAMASNTTKCHDGRKFLTSSPYQLRAS